jgi:hypothetical protein
MKRNAKPVTEQLSAAEMAERTGRTRQHVNRLAREGKLRKLACGLFDAEDPKNAAFLKEHSSTAARISPASVQGELPRTDAAGPVETMLSHAEIQRQKSAQQLLKLQIANRRSSGELVERPAVFTFAGHLAATLSNEVIALAQRLSPALAAAARSAVNDDAATVAVDGMLGKELYAAVGSVALSTRKFLKKLYSEGPDAAGPASIEASVSEIKALCDYVLAEVRSRNEAA